MFLIFDFLTNLYILSDFDNKGFEMEETIPSTSSNQFTRDRPGSMMSIKSNASTSSRSSVNCTTGKIKCPNFRMQKFFAYKPVYF